MDNIKGIERLGDIRAIDERIMNYPTVALLYKLIFPEEGRVMKKRLKIFRGFYFQEGTSEYIRKFQYAQQTFKSTELMKCCEILGLEEDGCKEDLINRILKGLINIKLLASAPNNQYIFNSNAFKIEPATLEPSVVNITENNDEPHGSTQENEQTHVIDELAVSIKFVNKDNSSAEKHE